MSWVSYAPGQWSHRPWWKRVVNTVLRFFQTRRRPARLLVLATKSLGGTDETPPEVKGYVFGRVIHL